jgi:hypothetical protein
MVLEKTPEKEQAKFDPINVWRSYPIFKKENKTTRRSVITCKLLSALLTLAVVISVIPLTLSAEAANMANATISLDKQIYLPNESIVVSASGITQEMRNADAWVGIYKAGAAHNKWGIYKWLEEGNHNQKADP